MKDALLKRFSPRLEFDSYEDFKQNFTIRVPDDFNFGYDVVDAWAELEPGKKALVWCNDAGIAGEGVMAIRGKVRNGSNGKHGLVLETPV